MQCKRCGIETPRLTVGQRYCPPCERQWDAIVERIAETRRKARWTPKDLTGLAGAL